MAEVELTYSELCALLDRGEESLPSVQSKMRRLRNSSLTESQFQQLLFCSGLQFQSLAGNELLLSIIHRYYKTSPYTESRVRGLLSALSIPCFGPILECVRELVNARSEPAFVALCKMIGASHLTYEINPNQAEVSRFRRFQELNEIEANLNSVAWVDLSLQRIFQIPEVLYRLPKLRYLELEDDYFNADQMHSVERRLSHVAIMWHHGVRVDGKHGR